MGCTTIYTLQNYLRQLFKPRRWKCDLLETTKQTQQRITCGEFSNKLVYFWEKVSKKESFLKNQWKSNFLRQIQAKKLFFFKNPRWNFSFFQKISWKTCFFLPRKRIEKRVTRKFGENFTETFGGHPKVSWNFRSPYESFMKLSSGHRKFHETFSQKMRNCTGTLDFIKKNVFAWIFFKKWLFLDLSKRCFLFYWNFLPEVN